MLPAKRMQLDLCYCSLLLLLYLCVFVRLFRFLLIILINNINLYNYKGRQWRRRRGAEEKKMTITPTIYDTDTIRRGMRGWVVDREGWVGVEQCNLKDQHRRPEEDSC